MSYKITCYFNSEHIDSTEISGMTGAYEYTGKYGDDYIEVGGFTGRSTFTATPASGCEFTQWVYRLGSIGGTVQYSEANPFEYSGDEDIYIRAEGQITSTEPDTPVWEMEETEVGLIDEAYYERFYVGSNTLYCFAVQFESAGTVTVYTEGSNLDPYGYLSTSSAWDDEIGEPDDYLEFDDDNGDGLNFNLTFEVGTDETYYIWVRGRSDEDYGYINFYVVPPVPRPNDFSWTYDKTEGEEFNLTATEWNRFTRRINAFREYMGLSEYEFTEAVSDEEFTAEMYNEARSAIRDIDGYGEYITRASSGQIITADAMNTLVSELNAIP